MDSSVRILTPNDILLEIDKFISGIARGSHTSNIAQLSKTGLNLLKNVPATRDAILEYFCNIFIVAVNKHVRIIETKQIIPITEEYITTEIKLVLNNFIEEHPKFWSSIISTWSLTLLGKLSSEYAKRGNLTVNAGINEFVQQWMACSPTRSLIEMAIQCFRYFMQTDIQYCTQILFDASNVYTSNFDWVVAHIASCFPDIIITRVLKSGLQDFCSSGFMYDIKNSRLNSLVEILSYLAGSHFFAVRTALLNLFAASLEIINTEEVTKMQRLATVPFLLNLSSLSPILLRTLTSDILQILKPHIIHKLSSLAVEWCKYFGDRPETLIDLTCQLVLGCEQGAFQIITILLDGSLNSSKIQHHNKICTQNVKRICREILELILERLDVLIRTHASKTSNITVLISIKQDMPYIIQMLLSDQPLKVQTAYRLISLVAIRSPNVLITSASFLLLNAKTEFQLAVLLRLIITNSHTFCRKKYESELAIENCILSKIIQQAIRDVQHLNTTTNKTLSQMFKNLRTLLRWEKSNKVLSLRSNIITHTIRSNLRQIASLLIQCEEVDQATNIIEMLDLIQIVDSECFFADVELMFKLTKAAINYAFLCMADEDFIQKKRGVRLGSHFLQGLSSYSSSVRILALRDILETSISTDRASLLGAYKVINIHFDESLLLNQNHKQGTGAILAQRHSSVFHAGVIGLGPRKISSYTNFTTEVVTLNTTLLVHIIKACCNNLDLTRFTMVSDVLTIVSLLLVELVSPDVMYNGLPWPEEEFTKVTVERDLQIRRYFKDIPVLWTLLQLTARYRPALTFCSVLLRGIAATIMSNWNMIEGKFLVEVMALGQLLPPPLVSIIDIIIFLEPHQINVLMRECIWAYMNENVPSPTLFTRIEGVSIAWRDSDNSVPHIKFTETLRLVLQANMHIFGALYAALFFAK